MNCSNWTPTVLKTILADNNTRTVINHNPLPDISHEEFISLLGPVLAPENYMAANLNEPSTSTSPGSITQSPPVSVSGFTPLAHSPAPFDWIHFEGRSVKTTLSNISGLEGLARERHWRSHCVFSLDVGRKSRQGVEAVRGPSFCFTICTLIISNSLFLTQMSYS